MFGFIKRKNTEENNSAHDKTQMHEQTKVEITTENIMSVIGKNTDVKKKRICINCSKNLYVSLVFIEGMSNDSYISEYVLKPLVQNERFIKAKDMNEVLHLIEDGNIYFCSQLITQDLNRAMNEVISGSCILIIDELHTAVIFDTKGYKERNITEPTVENVTKGAKDAFVETLSVNTSLVRRKIKDPRLVIEKTVIGEKSGTGVAVIYIDGLTNMYIVNEVKQRLSKIKVDGVVTTGIIEEYISDDYKCVFPQLLITERPDKFCAEILEGRVGIITDGLPLAFIAPGTLVQFMQAPEDYSRNYLIASIVRFMRFALMLLTLILPSVYIVVTSFHPEMMPTALALTVEEVESKVNFPVYIEIIMMLIAFEILYEASLRIPRTVGQAVTIIGTLVVGEQAVNSRIISPVVVLVIALTGISSFVMVNQDFSNAMRLSRFLLALMSSIGGLVGMTLGFVIFVYRLARLESFGVPYLSPFVGEDGKTMIRDTFFRFPLRLHKMRPISLATEDRKRVGDSIDENKQ